MKIGLDIGYSSVKIAYGDGTYPEQVQLPVGAGPERLCGVGIDGSVARGHGHQVVIDGEPWVAGVDPSRLTQFVPCMDASYSSSSEYRALFYAALAEVGAPVVDFLVTGLPVTHFLDSAHRKRLEALMTGTHHIREGLTVEVGKAVVVPQPAGAFTALLLDRRVDQNVFTVQPDASVLVVDPGHYSLDWVIFHRSFNMDSSGSTSIAGERIVRQAADLLSQRHGVRVPVQKLQEAVLHNAGPLVVGRHLIEFWPAMKEVARDSIRANLTALRGSVRQVTDTRGVDVVLVTGGGAKLFQDSLAEAFPEAHVIAMREPVTANARGFFAYCGQLAAQK